MAGSVGVSGVDFHGAPLQVPAADIHGDTQRRYGVDAVLDVGTTLQGHSAIELTLVQGAEADKVGW